MTTDDRSTRARRPWSAVRSAGTAGLRPGIDRALLIGGAALVVRLVYWIAFMRHYRPVSDAAQYIRIAHNFAVGHGIADVYPQVQVHATAFRPPLYPTMLGVLFKVFGTHVAVAQMANAVTGALVVVLVDILVTRVAGLRAGLVAAAIVGLSPSLMANDLVPLSEPLSLLLFMSVVLLLVDDRFVAAGVATGLLLLTRPSAPALAVVVVVWLVFKFGWNAALRFSGAAVVIIVPWIIRNEVRLHAPVLVTSNGFNINAVYSPEALASGGFVDSTVSRQFAWIQPAAPDEAKWDRIMLQHGIFGARTHPVAVMRKMIRNGLQMAELLPGNNVMAERLDGRIVTFRTFTLPLFYLTAALGVIGLWRNRSNRDLMLFVVLALALVAPSVATVAVPRLRAPLDLVLATGAGLFLATAPPARQAVASFRKSRSDP